MKVFVLFLLVVSSSISTFAQNDDSLFRKYNTGIIYRYGNSLMKGQERISFQELSREFSMSDLGFDQYKLCKKKKTIGKILIYVSLASGLVAASLSNSNRNLAYGFLGAQFISLMGGITYNQASYKHLDRAIWIRNKDYLFPDRQP